MLNQCLMTVVAAASISSFANLTSANEYRVALEESSEKFAMVIEETIPPDQLEIVLGRDFGRVANYLAALNVTPISGPMVQYMSYTATETHFKAGFFVESPVAEAESIKAITIPAGTIAVTEHVGSQAESGKAYEALHAWMESNGYEPSGEPWEVYLDNPESTPVENQRTTISYPVRKL